MRRVADLNGIASHLFNVIALDGSVHVARRMIKRMRPDPVAAHSAQNAPCDFEIAGALLEQDSAGRVVLALGGQRSAIFDLQVLDMHARRRTDHDRIVGNLLERQIAYRKLGRAVHHDAVVAVVMGKRRIGLRQSNSLRRGCPVAFDMKAREAKVGCAFRIDQRPPLKIGSRLQRRTRRVAAYLQIVRGFR